MTQLAGWEWSAEDASGSAHFGVEDFFDLGDSLNAIELVEQIDVTFGVTINLASLFEQMTIAKLAELIDAFLLSNVAAGSRVAAVHQEFDL